jgi:hypothetical protein
MQTNRLVLIAATALAGCAVNPRVEGVEPAGPPPMRVSIGFPVGRQHVYRSTSIARRTSRCSRSSLAAA